jgi:hypothetical protein
VKPVFAKEEGCDGLVCSDTVGQYLMGALLSFLGLFQ